MKCQHSAVCGNCSWMELPPEIQKSRKIEALKQGLQASGITVPLTIPYHLPPLGRDRVDLIFSENQYGFYKKAERSVFEVQECPQMSPRLFAFFQELKAIPLPIDRGSLRLRVSPDQAGLFTKGLWLDFAHTDIQKLFAEKKTLHQLMEIAFVEIGQRRKKLEWDGSRFRLRDPEYHPWTRTWIEDQAYPLNSLVGGFSQTGDLANQMIIQRLEALLEKTSAQNWLEFGCGQGNLTLPLAGKNRHVVALESDRLALAGLKKTLEKEVPLSERIQLISGDFQQKDQASFAEIQGLLLNPPRSGVQNFLSPLLGQDRRPQELIYLSCFLESFCKDAQKIKELCYNLKRIEIIDQFSHTPHFEILSYWSLE